MRSLYDFATLKGQRSQEYAEMNKKHSMKAEGIFISDAMTDTIYVKEIA